MMGHNPRGQQAVDISIPFTVVAIISVTLRLYTRWFIVRSPGVEDHLIIVASVRSLKLGNCREHTLMIISCSRSP